MHDISLPCTSKYLPLGCATPGSKSAGLNSPVVSLCINRHAKLQAVVARSYSEDRAGLSCDSQM